MEECRKVLEKMIADSGLEKRAVRGTRLLLPVEELWKVLENIIWRYCARKKKVFSDCVEGA